MAEEVKLTLCGHLKAAIAVYKTRIKERRHRNTNPLQSGVDRQQQFPLFLGADWTKPEVCLQQTSLCAEVFIYAVSFSPFVLNLCVDMTESPIVHLLVLLSTATDVSATTAGITFSR